MRELSFVEVNHVAGAFGANVSANATVDTSSDVSTHTLQLLAGGALGWTQVVAFGGAIATQAPFMAAVAAPVAAVVLFSIGYVGTPYLINGLDRLTP